MSGTHVSWSRFIATMPTILNLFRSFSWIFFSDYYIPVPHIIFYMNSDVEIVDVDEKGSIALPYKICEKIGIHPHDKLIIGVEDETLVISKQKRSVFDLQHKEVVAGTLKQALIFEQKMDQAGKKDMPV